MALDFPSSPTNGQIYGSYSWNSAKSAWQAISSSNTVAIIGSSFPASAKNGDIWVDSVDTTTYVYYDDGTSSQWVETLASPAIQLEIPAGAIMAWAGSTSPSNWLICDGSAVSRTTYAALFSVIGTTYGTGDNLTTFNLPNLQGKIPVGKNSGTFGTLGATGGAETVTLTYSQMPSHTHQLRVDGGYRGATGYPYIPSGGTSDPSYWSTFGSTTAEGGDQPHNNLQPYQVVNYVIKASAGNTLADSQLATRMTTIESRVSSYMEETMTLSLSDETTPISAGVAKLTFRVPYNMVLTRIPRASVGTASTSGLPTVDMKLNGTTMLSTKLSIDANEKTSTTAATAAVLFSSVINDDDELTFDVTVSGTGAKGLKVTLYYRRP